MKALLLKNDTLLSNGELLFISFLLNLFLTGIFAFMGFAYATNKLLPESYYQIKKPGRIKKLYKWMGVKYFKYLLILFFWGRKKNKKKFFDGTKNGLNNMIYQSKQSEFGHLGAFTIITLSSILLLYSGYYILALIVNIINIIANFYPIILQRHHRSRIAGLAKYSK